MLLLRKRTQLGQLEIAQRKNLRMRIATQLRLLVRPVQIRTVKLATQRRLNLGQKRMPMASDLPSEDNSTDREVGEVLNILDLPDETKKWLKKEYKTLKRFEEFIQMTSEKVKDMQQPTEKKARFKQDERETLILRRRWMEKNRNDGQEVEWEDYKCEELQYLCS
jgi:vacuolar-type H+-ATPase subunit I/STV1